MLAGAFDDDFVAHSDECIDANMGMVLTLQNFSEKNLGGQVIRIFWQRIDYILQYFVNIDKLDYFAIINLVFEFRIHCCN